MEITRDNYEVYFLDYLEGNLDEKLVDDFIEFIRENQDLKKELELAGHVKVEVENISFDKKGNLYKDKFDLEKEFNQAAVARLEDDLSEKEKANFEKYLASNPEKQKEAALFEKTKLQPDYSIHFPHKGRLYHHSTGRTVLLWTVRVAAILALAFLAYRMTEFNIKNTLAPKNQVAISESETKNETPEPITLPEKAEKKQEVVAANKVPKMTEEKTETENQSQHIQQKKVERQPNNGEIIIARKPIEIPTRINRYKASLTVQQPNTKLAVAHLELPETAEYNEERLLADVVREKAAINKFSLNTVTKAGLKLVSNISNEKFSYQTNREGEITELNFDSRLLAFSIPTKNE
ncbi:hypothetical protein D1164_18435 [Mariniphaga sediminis]|uniref:Uncharacterized protein n=2 Tax=Mariniphaga sediminis TaxID=1628158 RepID=A0A399CZ19_9BACT|nr:hypothetical protein [Mariniphaga sediminis]RIH63732.1 hypothetical protein D1164_18435 [Mariniphaga sediminis]